MIARIRKSMEQKDQGFTLIELLVVMIIIGILAAIAIPVFMNQRKKAVDTAAKSDVSILAKEVATHYVDNATAAPVLAIAGVTYTWGGVLLGPKSNGITDVGQGFAAAAGTDPLRWCVQVTYGGGTETTVAYGSVSGLAPLGSTCVAATGLVTP